MAKKWLPEFDDIPIDEALTLVVARKKGKGVEGWVVDLGPEAEDDLREACRRSLEYLETADAVAFSPDALIDEGEYLAVPKHVVGADHAILEMLREAGALDQLDAHHIPKLWFYAVVLGNDPDSRTAFIRKSNPHVVARAGRFIMSLGQALTVIKKPVFVIDDRFDVVTSEGGLAVLNSTPFETLFRGADEMGERVGVWVTAVSDHLPIDGDGAELLEEACRRNARFARRLRSIYRERPSEGRHP